MIRILSILIITVLLASCSNEAEIRGYWLLNFDEETEDDFIPYELGFDQDTLLIVDGHAFKHTTIYSAFADSISITFENGITKSYSFSALSDSTVLFADRVYFRSSKDYFSRTQSYELLGWSSNQETSFETNSRIVHLIREEDSTKVILNDVISDLKSLPDFMNWGHSQRPTMYIYVGKGIELKDLSNAYCWMQYMGYREVELVTANVSFEKFYSVQDYVNVDDSIWIKFQQKNRSPPWPPPLESNEEVIDVIVNSGSDITLSQQLDSNTYRYNFPIQLDIEDYLDLMEKLNAIEKRKLKRLRWEH